MQGEAATIYEIDRYALTHIRNNKRALVIPILALALFAIGLVASMRRFQNSVRVEAKSADGGIANRSVEISKLPQKFPRDRLSVLLQSQIEPQFPNSDSNPIVHIEIVPDLNEAYKLWLRLKRSLQMRKHYLELQEIQEKPIFIRKKLFKKHNAVSFYEGKVRKIGEKYSIIRAIQSESLGVAFITFKSLSHKLYFLAHFDRKKVALELEAKKWKVRKAPHPKEIIWENLNAPKVSVQIGTNAIFLVLFFIVLTPYIFQVYILKLLSYLDLGRYCRTTPLPFCSIYISN